MNAWPAEADRRASRIEVLVDGRKLLDQILTAAIMEEVWQAREIFAPVELAPLWPRFVDEKLPFSRADADSMATTWSLSRTSRPLREFAQRQPSEAFEVIQQAIGAGVRLQDETDEEVLSILQRPPRLRHQAIRGLIESAAPAENDAADSQPAEPRQMSLPLVSGLSALCGQIADLTMDAEGLALRGEIDSKSRSLCLQHVDSAHGALDLLIEKLEATK